MSDPGVTMTAPDEDDGDEQPGIKALLESYKYAPPSTTVEVTFGAQSSPGRSRLVNEDHYLVLRLGRHQETVMTSLPDELIASRFEEQGYAMVVADGMGPSGAGEAASHVAIATLVHLVRYFGKWNLRVDDVIAHDIMARVKSFYRHVDSVVVAYHRNAGAVRMDQTTLTAIFGAGHDLFFAHVGHSRAYLLRNGQLMRLTRDHTVGPRPPTAMARAPLVDVNVAARDLTHILTDTIGMRGSVGPTIDIERLQLVENDRVLVCTNGLTDMVDEVRIGEVLASDQQPGAQCRALVDLALAAGGDDDVTALVARYHLPP